jgi:hypothetical protein
MTLIQMHIKMEKFQNMMTFVKQKSNPTVSEVEAVKTEAGRKLHCKHNVTVDRKSSKDL